MKLKLCENGHGLPDSHKRCSICGVATPVVWESCCSNGHPNLKNRSRCSICEVRIPIQDTKSDQIQDTGSDVFHVFEHAVYLGGLLHGDQEISGVLVLDTQGIRMNQTEILQWRDCDGLTVDSHQVAKRKVAATLAFGILGGVAAKSSKDQSELTVRRNDGALAYFVIDRKNSHEVKAKIAPLLRSIGLPILGDFPAEASPSNNSGNDVASEIERLVALKRSGHIDEAEFKILKGKLLQ